MAVLPGQFRCNDGDIDLWNIKQASRNTLLRVNAGSISVGRHVVAANKSGLSLHRKLDNQFLAICTLVLLVGDVVLIEIKSGHAHRVRICVNRRPHVAAGRLLHAKARAVIIGGVKLHICGVRRHSEIRCHNVFNNRRAAEVNARLTDILADRREDSAQGSGIIRGQVVAGRCAIEVSGDFPAIIADAEEAGIVRLDADLRRIREVAGDIVQKAVSGRDVIVLDVSDPPPAKAGPVASDLAVAVVLEAAVAVELLWLRAIENTDRVHRRTGILQGLCALDSGICNGRIEIALRRRHTVRKHDHNLLPRRVAARVIVAAAHQRLCLLHAVTHIGCATRSAGKPGNLPLKCLFAVLRYRRPALQHGCVRTKCHNRNPVIRLLRVIFVRHSADELVHSLLHRILPTACVVVGAVAVEVIRHRAGLIQHKHDVHRRC